MLCYLYSLQRCISGNDKLCLLAQRELDLREGFLLMPLVKIFGASPLKLNFGLQYTPCDLH